MSILHFISIPFSRRLQLGTAAAAETPVFQRPKQALNLNLLLTCKNYAAACKKRDDISCSWWYNSNDSNTRRQETRALIAFVILITLAAVWQGMMMISWPPAETFPNLDSFQELHFPTSPWESCHLKVVVDILHSHRRAPLDCTKQGIRSRKNHGKC